MRALNDGVAVGGDQAARDSALGKADGKPVGQWRVGSGEVTSIDRTVGPKNRQVGKTSRTLKDEKFFNFKVKTDKKLRRLAREILALLEDRGPEMAGMRVCAGRCRKFGDGEWVFCARCGGPMREIENG